MAKTRSPRAAGKSTPKSTPPEETQPTQTPSVEEPKAPRNGSRYEPRAKFGDEPWVVILDQQRTITGSFKTMQAALEHITTLPVKDQLRAFVMEAKPIKIKTTVEL